MNAETEPRVWRQRRRGFGWMYVGLASMWVAVLIGGWIWPSSRGGAVVWPWLGIVLVIVFGLNAWLWFAAAMRVDERGIEQRPRPGGVRIAWSEVVDVRPNTTARFADHVLVETAGGEKHRLQMIPASDVEEVRSRWAAWGGGPVGDHP